MLRAGQILKDLNGNEIQIGNLVQPLDSTFYQPVGNFGKVSELAPTGRLLLEDGRLLLAINCFLNDK